MSTGRFHNGPLIPLAEDMLGLGNFTKLLFFVLGDVFVSSAHLSTNDRYQNMHLINHHTGALVFKPLITI